MNRPIQSWRNQKQTRKFLGKKGKILTWTKIFISPDEFKGFTPYPVALVELEDGSKVYGQIVDYEEKNIIIGQQVESVLRILHNGSPEGIVEYGLKFRPI